MRNNRSQNKSKPKSELSHIKTSGEYPYEERSKINPYVRPGSARTRGFRGSKYGPASEGRSFTKEEIAAVEQQMREAGKL